MRTVVVALGLFVVGCSAPIEGGNAPPEQTADPNAFLQPGGNSYSAPPNGEVVVLDPVTKYTLWGTRSSAGECMVMQPTLHAQGDIVFEDNGTVVEAPYDAQHAVGTWKQTGASDEVCLFGTCQTCNVTFDPNSTTCGVNCPNVMMMAEIYESKELIPFTFNCANNVCTTLSGANVNADGTITYDGFVLGTWQGTHVEAQICFGNECSLFHPTP